MKWLTKIVAGLLYGICLLASLVLFFYYWHVLTNWLGGILGTIAAFVVAPGVIVFPVVYWLIQRVFPTFYFELLGVSIGSAVIGALLWSLGSDDSN